MQVIKTEHMTTPIKMWVTNDAGVKIVPVEPAALEQLFNVASMPFIHKHVAVMPDVHLGKGATVGSVIPTVGAVIPAAVGVDIGCGMMAFETGLGAADLPDSLAELRLAIEEAVPVGNGPSGSHLVSKGAATRAYAQLWNRFASIKEKTKLADTTGPLQLGTLGGGNHFIEICLDESDGVWIMLHSGSRGIGNKIGSYFIERAKEDMRTHFINLPDRDLAYLCEGTQHFDDYVEAVQWAQDYASQNRYIMLGAIVTAVSRTLDIPMITTGDAIVQCHHNYISREHHFNKNVWITRKGAVNASAGKLGIIPGAMGKKSYIVKGKGNAESFNSCSHGAGRAMSRTEAKRRFTTDDLRAQTAGVECRKDEDVVDEIPGAYKDLDLVMEAQKDLVDIVRTLRAVLTVKG